jgi:hypothetical protein
MDAKAPHHGAREVDAMPLAVLVVATHIYGGHGAATHSLVFALLIRRASLHP